MESASAPISLAQLRECPDCGLFSALPTQHRRIDLCCARCGKTFRHLRRHPISWTLACAITGLLFYITLSTAPLLDVSLYGRSQWGRVTSGIVDLNAQGFTLIAMVIFAGIVLLPLLKIIGLVTVFGGLHLRRPPRWIPYLFRILKCLNPWTMAEIYLLGFMVAYTRLQAMTYVHIDSAVYALIGLTLSLVAIDTILDPEAVWQNMQKRGLVRNVTAPIGGQLTGCGICHQANPAAATHCLRCNGRLQERKANSLQRASALMLAGALLYIPANIFPVMNIISLRGSQPYTILRGVQEFLKAGLWPLAALVFVASILVPALKLVFLAFMLVQTHRKSGSMLLGRTRLYRFIDFIGRWSMIDIFMLSILVGVMRFGPLGQITAGNGATYFTAVILLNMLAVLSFDPRLMWDAAR